MQFHYSAIQVECPTCCHGGSAWPPLPNVVQHCEGTTVRSVRLQTKTRDQTNIL